MYFLPYNKNLKDFSRELRSNSALSEVLLWIELRPGTIRGYKFNRQKPLGRYIVDFYCKRLNLVIEIDGDSHHSSEAILKDDLRQKALEELGLSFLRFDDLDVKKQLTFVLDTINAFIDDFEQKNPPNPLS
ncbi:MAG: very-short-patch-repair endonuclease [Marinoscillum sp.]|jgi:very-short-patch-repair endonuclease